jgi:hypothetical protein
MNPQDTVGEKFSFFLCTGKAVFSCILEARKKVLMTLFLEVVVALVA